MAKAAVAAAPASTGTASRHTSPAVRGRGQKGGRKGGAAAVCVLPVLWYKVQLINNGIIISRNEVAIH